MKTISLNSAGNEIIATIFEPKGEVEYAIIMSCPTGTKQSYFKKFATYFCDKGFLVITYDYSGIGLSAPKKMKGYETSAVGWGVYDLTTVIDHIADNFEYKKLLLIGLSIGGQIAGISHSIKKVDGLINVASQSGYWKLWPIQYRYILFMNWHILALLAKLFGYFPGKQTTAMENLPKGVALDWSKWGLSSNYLFDHIEDADLKFSSIELPLISYSFSDDRTAPKNTVEWLNSKYSNCELHYQHIYPSDINVKSIGHFGFFREKCKVLWDDLIEKINVTFKI